MSTKLGTILADFTTSLATDIAIGGTTATLSSATDDDSVALPSGRYFFTLDGTNSSKEHISCDLVGTSLTNIKSLSRQGVETTGCVRKHRIGTTVSLTDFGHIKFINDLVSGATSLNSAAPLGYDGAPASLAGNQLATVTYVLSVVNGGTVYFDQQVISAQTSGEALAINDIVYLKESDARWYKVDADLTATFDTLQLAVNKTTAAGAGVTIQIAISGPVSGFAGLTPGAKYYLSNTSGAITTTPGTNSVFVGWALTSTILLFDPILKTLPTQKEKDAMVGTQGVPASNNKFVTSDNASVSSTDQTQTTQNSSIELGEADTTTKKNKTAQSFIAGRTKNRGVYLYKSANTGTFIGTVTVALQADSSGSPSGSDLATKTFTNVDYNTLPVGEFLATFSTEYASQVIGSTYWIVISSSTSDNSNHPNLGTNTAGGYSSGSVKYNNTTDGWVAVSTIDLYFKTLEGNASQLVKTNSSGLIPSDFFSLSNLPIPSYQQRIPLLYTGGNVGICYGAASNQSGSVLVLYTSYASSEMVRLARDSVTGAYFVTHEVNSAIGGIVSTNFGMIVLGDYVYVFYDNVANLGCYRYDLATLANETVITVPAIATAGTSLTSAWTDGVYAYVMSDDLGTTVNVLSLSGTTFSTVTTATAVSGNLNGNRNSSFFDGTYPYVAYGTFNNFYKLTTVDGSAGTLTTIKWNDFNDTDQVAGNSFIILNIDTTRMYVGKLISSYDETNQQGWHLILVPITKP